MIGITREYEKMYLVEEEMWWYKHLHQTVVDSIQASFGDNKQIAILDVGCGTGGLLKKLSSLGYQNASGIDGSSDGVALANQRGLSVSLFNLNDVKTLPAANKYDVISCIDVLYCFPDEKIVEILKWMGSALNPNGIIIVNNNAFNAFKGGHDIALGIKKRFTKKELVQIVGAAGLRFKYNKFWNFLPSPLIFLFRKTQLALLAIGVLKPNTIKSDVNMPSAWVNSFFYKTMKF